MVLIHTHESRAKIYSWYHPSGTRMTPVAHQGGSTEKIWGYLQAPGVSPSSVSTTLEQKNQHFLLDLSTQIRKSLTSCSCEVLLKIIKPRDLSKPCLDKRLLNGSCFIQCLLFPSQTQQKQSLGFSPRVQVSTQNTTSLKQTSKAQINEFWTQAV